jgi:hypothetical protein
MTRRKGGAARRGVPLTLALLLAVASALSGRCSRVPPLVHTFSSPEELARTVLGHLAAGDRDTLRTLALSEDEFRRLVWPQLPAARPERNLPFSYVWRDLAQKSDASLAELVERFRGQRLAFVRIDFTGERTVYDGFEVSRGSRVWVRDADGQERSLRAFGSMLRQGARVKVFSYVVD